MSDKAPTTTRQMFETTECSRCGGIGRYSWNQRDGSRCWGCNGSGLAYTKAGAAAHAAWKAQVEREIPAKDVELGMVVTLGGHGHVANWVKVDEIAGPRPAPGFGNDGYVTFRNAAGRGMSTHPDWTVRVRASNAERVAIYERMLADGVPGVVRA